MAITKRRKKQPEYFFDYTLLFVVLFLLGFGLIMIYSTSSYEASLEFNDPAYYFRKQALSSVIGLISTLIPAIAIP